MFSKILKLVDELNKIPNVHLRVVSQNEDALNLKIELTGELMKTYMQLGEIQEEFKSNLDESVFDFTTIYGDGQDAIFIIKKVL